MPLRYAFCTVGELWNSDAAVQGMLLLNLTWQHPWLIPHVLTEISAATAPFIVDEVTEPETPACDALEAGVRKRAADDADRFYLDSSQLPEDGRRSFARHPR